ncbi:MAG: DUF47 family protein [Smithellaceae bacterium]|nr:DUF47 family protein [Smithellaceae bacterium]
MFLIFKKTKSLENQIEEFLATVEKGALSFQAGIKCYLSGGEEKLNVCLEEISALEGKADDLRREIETSLYTETLIPESRGDVLGLIESTDHVLNLMEETLQQFSVEIPEIAEELHGLYIELGNISAAAVTAMVKAIRSYFRDLQEVRDNINKVIFYEKEADRLADRIKRRAFRMELKLCNKIHMRYFAYHIEYISDMAENVCDRLAIATIKRYM